MIWERLFCVKVREFDTVSITSSELQAQVEGSLYPGWLYLYCASFTLHMYTVDFRQPSTFVIFSFKNMPLLVT